MTQSSFTPAQRIPDLVRSDGELLQRAARLNRLMISMNHAAEREAFARDPQAVMARHGLTAEESDMFMRRDWKALLAYGVSVYALAKGAKAFQQSLFDIGAQMRGCTVAQLQAQLPCHTLHTEVPHG